ncbi:DUF805 domain-containing protein [Lutimaribacter marinistellae]|uniref:DUF805 domain-containing protein n=1 Tax=Lutimaribacter marinistellae TaxID=1820329 RepID=A0ABV7TDV8_9RHOB
MSFTDAIKTCFSKYFTFSGRASRPEYWWFFLFIVLGNVVAGILDAVLFDAVTGSVETGPDGFSASAENNGPVAAIFSLAVLIPQLAAGWRRMHDTGRSGFYLLLPLLMSIAAVLILVFGIGLASAFQHGGSFDRFMTGSTILLLIPTGLVLIVSPLLVLWWLTRPSEAGENRFGPPPAQVAG